MAPEVIARPDHADPRSDLYGVAAIGYFMLTGRHLFDDASPAELYAAHQETAPIPPHERLGRRVAPDLEALLLRGLSKSPSDRPPTAASFRAALLRCQVTPWTEDDARAWWRTRGERARRRDHVRAPSAGYHPTVTIVADRDREAPAADGEAAAV
jgi:serine/threonine-protein kinase